MKKIALTIGIAALVLTLVPVALAGKSTGGKGRPGGGGTTGGSGLTLVLLNSPDAVPNWGEQVTFNISTTATAEPHVSLKCSQSGTVVYTTQTGYYASYPWPWTQTMTLMSGAWTSGAADCVARLYSLSNSGGSTTLGSLSFHVEA